ncbi:DUF5403 family protein [Salininema proteolyticum]|uniref:DUF5403 family protein n=1 Tax=Salininema proteolyticum TaxID=1607685 RepID=A0ABV8TZR3_9ACTN
MGDLHIYQRVPDTNLKLEKTIGQIDGVQEALRDYVFAAKARGDVMLIEHRVDGHAELQTEAGKVDHYLVLSDERGERYAAAIEFGRAAYKDPDTGTVYPQTDGLFILHKAMDVPIKHTVKPLKIKARRKPGPKKKRKRKKS